MKIIGNLKLKQHIIRNLFKAFYYDAKRFYRYATSVELDAYSENRLIGYIIAKYHIIEKGLTMPDMRAGFGKQTLEAVIDSCSNYYSKYGAGNCQVNYAVNVLSEYLRVHEQNNHKVEPVLTEKINSLQKQNPENYKTDNQKIMYKEQYFTNNNSPFLDFAYSRHSLRNFSSEEVSIDDLNKAIILTQNTTPTSCNRQSVRVHVVLSKKIINEILKVQTGNRGFGHLTNKLIVLSSEVSVYNEARERNLPYIDSGIYAMNLLYALHFYEIGACPLNWSAYVDADIVLREILGIPDSEIIALIIICGKPADEFRLATSRRFNLCDVTKYY